ncbi:DUF4271 domain-containing protein [Sphingobacterium sp. SGG-5]|uniref:DUF4271 domain-containing protein n=1 Tax=Sphingobacterium sp. SGG-5 TaxID=2710881 RepID=UPI0013EBE28E|nr:DUF4271 domain-containing protein [Sphingobacterium sp. SGG-5]NGM62447.1 DUF4271 domain-containing protein [Sphingobacterium sp. SGG-5]
MLQKIFRQVQINKKGGWIKLLFLFFCSSSLGVAQEISPVLRDSSVVQQADSAALFAVLQDSLAKQYIYPAPSAGNPMLDSLRKYITVEGNDFIRWMHDMDALTQADTVGYSKTTAAYKPVRPTWVVVVFIALALGIAMVRLFFAAMFRNIVLAYYDKQILQNMSKEDNMITSWPYIFLYILFSFSLALFLLVYTSSFHAMEVLTLKNFFNLSGIVALLFVLKILFVRGLALIFEIEKIIREYVLILYLVYFNSMLILMPVLLVLLFVPAFYFKFLLILFAGVVFMLFLYRFVVAALSLLGQLKFSIFYLILYLCSLEIAPILILVKMLNN